MGKQDTSRAMPKRFLVHDEIEWVPSKKGNVYPFRIRIWQADDREPVVLVSQHRHGPPPGFMVNKLLNHVYAGLLRYPARGMIYFHDYAEGDDRALFQALFETFGCDQRARLYRPIDKGRSWYYIEALVGEKVER